MEESLKRAHEDDDEPMTGIAASGENSAKRQCLPKNATESAPHPAAQPQVNPSKNSMAILNEIKNIQPIKFEEVSQEGPSHSPNFTCSLSININGSSSVFYGSGKEKKKAKLHAAVLALNHVSKIPDFLNPFQVVLFNQHIQNDLKSLNLTSMSFESLNSTSFETIREDSSMKIETLLTESSFNLKLPPVEKKPDPAQAQAKTEQAAKIRATVDGYLKSDNVPSLFNYLVPNEFCLYNLRNEAGTSHSKTFETELRVMKNFPESPRTLIYKTQPPRAVDKNNALIKETADELFFLGMGKSKAASRINALRIAIEFLFTIKLEKHGI
jgi:dsRNA-specific ribonuclease